MKIKALKNSCILILEESASIALCRCGASKNKPYCDGSHKDINFQADSSTIVSEEDDCCDGCCNCA